MARTLRAGYVQVYNHVLKKKEGYRELFAESFMAKTAKKVHFGQEEQLNVELAAQHTPPQGAPGPSTQGGGAEVDASQVHPALIDLVKTTI